MKKGDLIWAGMLFFWISILVIPTSREHFIEITELHPYMAGFVKYSILATMGDLLAMRIVNKQWTVPKSIFAKSVIWGIIGIMVTLVFVVYMEGTVAAQKAGRLPFQGVIFARALFGSAIMNVTFGPIMMTFHRFTDMFIDLKNEDKKRKVTLSDLVEKNDWHSLVEFAWMKTCIFFWIPVHTLVFLMPPQYRVVASAFLSIVMGLMLAYIKMGKNQNKKEAPCSLREM